MSSHRERQTEALEDLEFYARQRYEREYRERHGIPEERYVDNSSIGKPYVPPRLAAVRAVSTGWHFLPVASWMCQLTLALVERMDLPLWPVVVGWVVLGLAAPAALVLTAKRQRIPLRLQRSWAARRILTRVERRTSYSAFALALNASRGTAAVALLLGVYAVLGGAQTYTAYQYNSSWTFLLGALTVLLAGLGLSPLFNGLRLLKLS
jgi:hypothetical protein